MKNYFRHYSNLAITDIADKSHKLTIGVENSINRELRKLGYKPNTLEWYNKRYIIALDRLRKIK